MGANRVIRRIAILFAALLAGLIIVWLMMLALGVGVRLDVLRDPVETAASQALGRDVHISGPIELRPTLGPTVVVHGVRIASPGGKDGADLLLADRVEARLGLIDLLRGRPYIARLLIQNASITLETRRDGSRNWRNAGVRTSKDHAPSRRPSGNPALAIRQRELRDLALRNIVLSYRDDRTGQHYQRTLDEISGSVMPDQPLDLLIRGGIQQETCVAHLTGGNLSELLAYSGNWPLQITVTLGDASLVLHGTLDASHPDEGTALAFDLHGERLPVMGESMLQGRIAATDSGLDLTVGEARLGQSALQGRVAARFDAKRPRITGDLQVSRFDAALLAAIGSTHAAEASSSPHPRGESPAGPSADVPKWLQAVDLDAVIAVREFLHTPIALRDASLRLSVRDGRLSAPLDVLIADVPFHGELVVHRQGDSSLLNLGLAATDANAAKLAEPLTRIAGIRGSIKHIDFHAATNVARAAVFLTGFDIRLNLTGARLSYGNVAGGRPVELTLDNLALTIPAGKEMSVIAQGTLLNAPLSIEFTGGAVEALFRREAWPVDLSATGGGATLGINGSLASARGDSPTRLNLHLSGNRLGDLTDWFGVSRCAQTPYTARGQLIISENVGRLQFLQARLGETQLNADLDWSVDEPIPLLHAVMHFDPLDPADLDGLKPVVASGEKGVAIDMPILPRRVEIENADLDMAIEQLLIKPVEITDVSLSSQIRGGKTMRSPFHAHIGTTSFQGYLDPSGTATDVVLEFEGNDKLLGNTLNDLFSTAARWAGNAAVVPLQWLFKKELSAKGTDDCRDSDSRMQDHPQQRRDTPAASRSGD